MNREEKLGKIKEIILEKVKVSAIILFGSYARNKERSDSDIDIAIRPKIVLDKFELINLQNELEESVNIDIHLINLNTIEEDFRYDILMTGKELYVENQVEFIEYKLKAFNEYLELSEDRKIIIDKIKKGGTLYGK